MHSVTPITTQAVSVFTKTDNLNTLFPLFRCLCLTARGTVNMQWKEGITNRTHYFQTITLIGCLKEEAVPDNAIITVVLWLIIAEQKQVSNNRKSRQKGMFRVQELFFSKKTCFLAEVGVKHHNHKFETNYRLVWFAYIEQAA